MRILILFCLCLLITGSCSSGKHVRTVALTPQTAGMLNGLSFESAIIINDKTETAGINSEYKWLGDHYPGYKMKQQSLTMKDKRSYDVMDIVTSDGKDVTVYFDISGFFGKF